jgi:hypothetical protein
MIATIVPVAILASGCAAPLPAAAPSLLAARFG